jgi:hypothetical protein
MIAFNYWDYLYFVAQALLPVHDALINYLIVERRRPSPAMIAFNYWDYLYFVAQALLPVHDALINYLIVERRHLRLR